MSRPSALPHTPPRPGRPGVRFRRLVALGGVAAAVIVPLLSSGPTAGADTLPIPVLGESTASIAVNPATAVAGDAITVTGQAHPAVCGVQGVLAIAIRLDGVTVATTTPDANGAFSTTVVLADDIVDGAHRFSSACSVNNVPLGTLAAADMIVVEPTTATTATTSPTTSTTTSPTTTPPTTTPPTTTPPTTTPTTPPPPPTRPTEIDPGGPPLGNVPQGAASNESAFEGTRIGTDRAGETPHDRSGVAAFLPAPDEIATDLGTIASNLLGVLLLLLVLGLPAELINETMEQHVETEHDTWLRRMLGRAQVPVSGATGLSVFGGLAVVAALVNGFLDPGFGFDMTSLAQTVGFALAFTLVTLAWELPGLAYLRSRAGEHRTLEILPLGLAVAAASVVFCRIADIHPGYAFGVLAAVPTHQGRAGRSIVGRSVGLDAVSIIVLAVASYLVWGPVDNAVESAAGGASFGLLALDAGLAAIVLAALSCLTFSLAPLAFLKGHALFHWSRAAWASLVGIGLLGMLHLVVHPLGGFGTLGQPTPTRVLPFAVITLAAFVYWAYVRHIALRARSKARPAASAV